MASSSCHLVPASLLYGTTAKSSATQDVLWWQDTYQAIDWLFIGTGPGERFAHEQLSRFASELSTDGRELARKLEKKMRESISKRAVAMRTTLRSRQSSMVASHQNCPRPTHRIARNRR
jgi:predicted  nucleic acid-binding Zn ribbon protein